MKKQTFLYLDEKDFIVLKLVGELRFVFAPTLENGLKKLKEFMAGKDVIIDITDVQYADSTMLGILTGFFIREEEQGITISKAPTIVCNDKDMQKILCNIGFDKYFNFKDADARLKENVGRYKTFDEIGSDPDNLEEYVKSAHELLKEVDQNKADHDRVIRSFKE